MDDLLKQITEVTENVKKAIEQLDIDNLDEKLQQLQQSALAPDFWSDNLKAQDITREISKLDSKVTPWRELEKGVKELQELIALDDQSLRADLEKQLTKATEDLEKLKAQLRLSGPYDDFDAIVSIHAGAGGTDAQDWAQMLLRMYVRWAESNDMKTTPIEESTGDEAGLKSATFEISGSFAYGKLKGEHGVHRLVRLKSIQRRKLVKPALPKSKSCQKLTNPTRWKSTKKTSKLMFTAVVVTVAKRQHDRFCRTYHAQSDRNCCCYPK